MPELHLQLMAKPIRFGLPFISGGTPQSQADLLAAVFRPGRGNRAFACFGRFHGLGVRA